MLLAGRFDPPLASDLAFADALRREAAGGRCRVAVVAGPSDRFPLHTRVRWLRALLPGADVLPWDAPAGLRLPLDAPAPAPAGTPLPPFDALGPPFDALGPPSGDPLLAGADDPFWLLPTAAADAAVADPMGGWHAFPAPVRPAFVRRVRLFGAESSGKTSMAAHLAARYDTVWVEEQWRRLFVAHGHRWAPEHVLEVVAAQLEAEEQAAARACRLLLCDTDPLTTLIYARAAFAEAPAWLEAYCDSAAYAARYAATLLFAPDLPWEPDPVREGAEARARYFPLFEAELALRRLPYTRVHGAGADRERIGEAVAERVLAAPERVPAAPATAARA